MREWIAQLRRLKGEARAFVLSSRWGRALRLALKAYIKHGCVYMTGALSFYAMVSLIPLTFLAFWLLTQVIGSSAEAQQQLEAMLQRFLLPEVASDILQHARNLWERGLLTLLGAWWGVLAFLWSGIRFYELLHHILSIVWGGAGRPFFQGKLWTFAAFLMAALFFGLTMLLTTAVATIDKLDAQLLGISLHNIWGLVARTLPWAFSIAMIFLLYKFLPNTYVPWRLALAAAVPVGLLWELSKRIAASLVASSGLYNDIYGPMASFILLMMWVYMSSVIVLFGAEYAAAWRQLALEERGRA
ncbi:YihY/virulence factor BrkB family protein [bacterium]|nr:YihY/virulence factor BrkB family protein [bacterium]